MEEFIPKEDIKSYLMVLADQSIFLNKLDADNVENEVVSDLVSKMHKSIVTLIDNHLESKLKLFNQVLPDVCRTCALK